MGAVARQVVAAWALAVNGDDTALMAMAEPDAAHWLLHPAMEPWRVAPGPAVTHIKVSRFDADAEPAQLRVDFEFTGRRRFDDPTRVDNTDGDLEFIARLDLTLSGNEHEPWRLSSGSVWTMDQYRGYVFTSRRESPQEYRERTGTSTDPATTGASKNFRLIAGFAEHDERLGSTASVEVRRETAPTRDQAEELVWPAVWAETTRALGDGDWRPSLNWLDVIELLAD
jgi:hypothetical protein